MTILRPGQRVHVTETDEVAVIWDAAPGTGCYWAHLLPSRELVRIKVTYLKQAARPQVIIKKEWDE